MKLLVLLLLPCLSLSEVDLVTGFANCDQYFLGNEPPRFTPQWGPSVKKICQCLLVNNQPNYFYATLYNTDWKIPIYSAYVIGTPKVRRVDPWYIEPQLDGYNNKRCMATQGQIQNTGNNNQAVNDDYIGSNNHGSGYDKGHLFAVNHTNNHLSMLATSTLTNAAPQDLGFNRGKWRVHEQDVITDLESCVEAYVVTGVVPDHTVKLNNRVTVSKYYWRATCCLKNGVFTGQGYFGPNQNNVVEKLSITALQTQLAKDYGVNIVIFPNLPPGYPTGGCS